MATVLAEKGLEPESNVMFTSKDVNPPQLGTYSIPAPLSEGVLFDCVELFRGSGNWPKPREDRGFVVHPGIELDGRCIRVADVADRTVFHELVSLAARRVIRD